MSIVILAIIFAIGLGIFILGCPIYITGIPFVLSILAVTFFRNPKVIVNLLILTMPLIIGYSHFMSIFPGSPFSISLLGILNVTIPLLILVYLFINKIEIRKCSLCTPITIFLVILGISVFYAYSPFRGLREWFRIAMPIMFYYMVVIGIRVKEEKIPLLKLMNLILISSILPLGIGFWQLMRGDSTYVVTGLPRIYGTFGHPNRYATFLIISSLVAIFLLLSYKSVFRRTTYSIFLCAMVISLFFTFTRVGWIAFLVSVSTLGFLKYRKFYILFFSILISVFLLLPNLSKSFMIRAKPDSSFYGRFELNKLSINLFRQSPIWGHGLSSYIFLSNRGSSIIKREYGENVGIGQHNDYFKFLTECGPLGLLSYLFLMYSALKLAKRIFQTNDSTTKAFGTISISMIIAVLVIGVADMGLQMAGIYPWVLLGIGELQTNIWDAKTKR